MSYRASLGILTLLASIALAGVNMPGPLEAAGQALGANMPPAFDDDERRQEGEIL